MSTIRTAPAFFFLPLPALACLIVCCAAKTAVPLHSRQYPVLCGQDCQPVIAQTPEWNLETTGAPKPIHVPGYWTNGTNPPRGFGTYRLRFELLPGWERRFNALSVNEAPGAARVVVNATEVGKIGRVSRNPAEAFEVVNCAVFPVAFKSGTNEILVEVSNHSARSGGLLGLRIGDRDEFLRENLARLVREAALAGTQFFVAALFLVLHITAAQGRAYFYFACFSVLTGLHNLASQGFLETLIPEVSWIDLRLFAEYTTGIALPPAIFFLFLVSFIPGLKYPDLSMWSGRLILGLVRAGRLYVVPVGLGIPVLCAISGSAAVYGQFQPAMVQLYMVPSCVILASMVVLAASARLQGALEIGFGSVILSCTALCDAAAAVQADAAVQLASAGNLVLTMASAVALARERSALIAANREFGTRVAQANTELLAMDQSKDAFLLRVARVIRADMESLLESAALLLSKHGLFPQEHLPHLGAVMDRARHLTGECARAEYYVQESRRPQNRSRLNLTELIRLEAILISQATGLQIDVHAPRDVTARVDPAAMKVVMREMAENAHRHSRGSPMRVEIAHSPGRRPLIRFGFGPASGQSPGAPTGGLGLAIVTRIAESHGGECHIGSTPEDFNVVLRLS